MLQAGAGSAGAARRREAAQSRRPSPRCRWRTPSWPGWPGCHLHVCSRRAAVGGRWCAAWLGTARAHRSLPKPARVRLSSFPHNRRRCHREGSRCRGRPGVPVAWDSPGPSPWEADGAAAAGLRLGRRRGRRRGCRPVLPRVAPARLPRRLATGLNRSGSASPCGIRMSANWGERGAVGAADLGAGLRWGCRRVRGGGHGGPAAVVLCALRRPARRLASACSSTSAAAGPPPQSRPPVFFSSGLPWRPPMATPPVGSRRPPWRM